MPYYLIEPPCLFDFGNFSYLYVIRTPLLLETSEYIDFRLLGTT